MRLDEGDIAGLQPLIAAVVRQTIDRLEPLLASQQAVFTEIEGAEYLRLRPHQLRDARLRGDIGFSRGPKNCVRYTRENLMDYLKNRREESNL